MQVIPKDASQRRVFQRRNLRIAIRQLERAEMYVGALRSLELEEQAADRVEAVLAEMTALHQYFLAEKAAS